MKNFDNSGFTLIEIIVVLIIIGILASIALPNLFANIQKSRAEEALATISTYRPTIESCVVKAAGVNENTRCNTAALGVPIQSANFVYALTPPANGTDTSYKIVATGTNALQATDALTMARTSTSWPAVSTTINCVGGSALEGAC